VVNRVLYFEDFQVGEEGETCGRTFTEGDLVQFAGISCDFCPPHMDRQMMSSTQYGERISHGFFLNSLATGMLSWHAPHITGRDTPTAYLRSLVSHFPVGMRIGDTVKFHWTVQEKTPDPAMRGFGIVKTDYQFINQNGGIAGEGTVTTGVRMKDTPQANLQIKPGPAFQYDEWDVDFNKVYYYEDFIVGKGEKSGGRVVTETDVVNYMSLMGDYDRLYTDPLYAKETLFGERIVPWMLVADFVGLGLRDGSYFNMKKPFVPYAGHLGDDITFIAPAKIGDVLYVIFKIESARVSKTKPDRGVLVLAQQVVNQRNEGLVEVRLATTVPIRAAMEVQPKETMWVLHNIKNRKE
jgi:3-hydroxybutyryl-CoA dehydratase